MEPSGGRGGGGGGGGGARHRTRATPAVLLPHPVPRLGSAVHANYARMLNEVITAAHFIHVRVCICGGGACFCVCVRRALH